ncbi:unnamed protein product [Prorocentrum cordatum]|uniref:Vps41 beta-propeller domain-containing protein n=1 Tax=Prorocentrum cordatum TaxID=2364126 RepID=A0ABN9UYY6_9DINO|nr:unnamed protein product [Polarella glacialis]
MARAEPRGERLGGEEAEPCPQPEPDCILCAAAHGSALVVGTRRGLVLALPPGAERPREVQRRGGSVLDVAVDAAGAFVASCCSDCSVAVSPLRPQGGRGERASGGGAPGRAPDSWTCSYPRQVLSVAICPDYASGAAGSKTVCVGGEECKLILSRRGIFDSRSVTVHAGEGAVSMVRWRATLIAWVNAKGVKVVDVGTFQKVTHIPQPPSVEPAASGGTSSCCVTWSADDVLLVGWGSVVMVAVVRQKEGGVLAGVRFASVAHCFQLSEGFLARSVAAFDDSHLAILAQGPPGCGTAHHVYTWAGDLMCSEPLPQDAEAEAAGSSALLLACAAHEHATFIVTAEELVSVERRTVVDHVDWLVEHGRFEAAVALAASDDGLGDDDAGKHRVCATCVASLLAGGEPLRATRVVAQLGITSAETWKRCVELFDEAGELTRLVPVIPAPPGAPPLPCEVYDAVLQRLVAVAPGGLLAALDRWPSSVYSAGPLSRGLQEALPEQPDTPEQRRLAEALATLREAQGEKAEAARLLAQIGSELLFPFLARHLDGDAALGASARGGFGRLFDLSPEEALELCVARVAAFPPSSILEALEPCGGWWQHRYLNLLARREPAAAQPFLALRLSLLAELEPHRLGLLLEERRRPSDGGGVVPGGDEWPVDAEDVGADEVEAGAEHPGPEVLEIFLAACRPDGGFAGGPAVKALLLEQQGCWGEALAVQLEDLGDVHGAVRLVAGAPQHLAAQLWDAVCSAALTDARASALLLANLSEASDPLLLPRATPARLVRGLPAGLEVPRAAQWAARALGDSAAERDLNAMLLGQLRQQIADISHRIRGRQRRGRAVRPPRSNAAPGPADAALAAAGAGASAAPAALLLSHAIPSFP